MPKSAKTSRAPRGHAKRYGKHHRRGRDYAKTYLPYLPLFVSIIASIFLSFWQPRQGSTLAYATSTSVSGLLSSTNSHRANNGKAALSLNSKLNASAQAKANDMVARNYWAHNTPDGQEPWVFFDNAGYVYHKAGENLAYGFATSTDTVAGWMNSPSHKANMLDGTFKEVGFGFANGPNYNGDGQQTVVVAHYGQPQVAPATTPPPAAPSPVGSTAPATQQAPAPTPKPVPKKSAEKKAEKPKNPLPITTEQPSTAIAAAVPQNISKAQTLTNGRAPWIAGLTALVAGLALITLLLHHSLKARHLWHDIIHGTERFVLHHPLLESTLLGIALLATVLSRTAGTIH
jgi:uncharacterized protein YkwD